MTGIILSVSIEAYTQDQKKNTTNPTDLNGNYKHILPTSEGHRFKDNFGKPPKDSVNRNYKPQNQAKRTVRFKDHFRNEEKHHQQTYKDPKGL